MKPSVHPWHRQGPAYPITRAKFLKQAQAPEAVAEPSVEASPKVKLSKKEFQEKVNQLAQGRDYETIDLFKG